MKNEKTLPECDFLSLFWFPRAGKWGDSIPIESLSEYTLSLFSFFRTGEWADSIFLIVLSVGDCFISNRNWALSVKSMISGSTGGLYKSERELK